MSRRGSMGLCDAWLVRGSTPNRVQSLEYLEHLFTSVRRAAKAHDSELVALHLHPVRPEGRPPPISDGEGFMASYKVEQRRLWHRGRTFHFVSYAGRPANEDRGELGVADMWFLMSEGKRHPVIPQVKGQETAELDQALLAWLDEYVFTRALGDHAHGGV